MHVWLVDYDGKRENLALMRIAAYHKTQGDTIALKHGDAWPELFDMPDRVYISCIFGWNKAGALRLADAWGEKAMVGGSGVSATIKLPPEVQAMPPDYDLYGNDQAIGFISRGCIRKCPWCIVPAKEGHLHRVSTAQEIVGSRKTATFLDNNFLALEDYQTDLQWLIEHNIHTDFDCCRNTRDDYCRAACAPFSEFLPVR